MQDEKPMFYIYRQIMDGRVQTGLVATVSVDEYFSEYTREAKEIDRINHFDVCDANTELIFLTYRENSEIRQLLNDFIKRNKPQAAFTSEDEISHYVWAISSDELIRRIGDLFREVPALYIVDGHHRSASAAKVALKRREQYPDAGFEAEFNCFLAVISMMRIFTSWTITEL